MVRVTNRGIRISRSIKAAVLFVAVGTMAAACATSSPSASSPGGQSSQTITVDGIKFPKPELTTVNLGASAVSVSDDPLYLIKTLGLDKKFGINLNVHIFEGATEATQALLAGSVQVVDASGGTALSSLQTPTPSALTFVTSALLSDDLFTSKSISSPSQLIGKKIAISGFGTQSYATALTAVEDLGLKPSQVTFEVVGGNPQRLAALEAGSVDASIQADALKVQLLPKGYHDLWIGSDHLSGPGYPTTSLTIPMSMIKNDPNTVLALTAMYYWGAAYFLTDPSAADNAWQHYSGEPLSEATSDVKLTVAIPQVPKNFECTTAMMEFVKQTLVGTDPKLKSANAAETCNTSFDQELVKMGWQKKIGVPGY